VKKLKNGEQLDMSKINVLIRDLLERCVGAPENRPTMAEIATEIAERIG
jgi:hypothetical protein